MFLSSIKWSSFGIKFVVKKVWCDERLKTKVEESTLLSDTGGFGELEHLKIKTRLIDEKFPSVMGECVI
jgi:hypothetical protein